MMLTALEQLVKLLQAILELLKEAKKAPLIVGLVVSILLNIWLGSLYVTSNKKLENERKDWALSDKKKDSTYNAYILKINEMLISQQHPSNTNHEPLKTPQQ